MKVINITRQTLLAREIELADTFLKRIKGLLGRDSIPEGKALVICPCNSIHTFFMKFPIDVVFVDKDYRVVKTILGLRPFRLTSVYLKAHMALELPCGTIVSSRTEVSDNLLIK